MRMYIHSLASSLSLSGWVKNLDDGRVEAVFEGPLPKIQKALDDIREGRFSRHIAKIDVQWEESSGSPSGFDITFQ